MMYQEMGGGVVCVARAPSETGRGLWWLPSLTGNLFPRSSGSWMSSPQPPPCAISMTCESDCAGFQGICRPYLPLRSQLGESPDLLFCAVGYLCWAVHPSPLCNSLWSFLVGVGGGGLAGRGGRGSVGCLPAKRCLLLCFSYHAL